jgi:very-short-patch-repair endonuclease
MGKRGRPSHIPDAIRQKYTIYYNKWRMPYVLIACEECGRKRPVLLNKGKPIYRRCILCNTKDPIRRQKISQALKGRPFSEVHRHNLSEAWQGRSLPPALLANQQKGRRLSKEIRQKMSKERKGRIVSAEAKVAISRGTKQAWQNPEKRTKRIAIIKKVTKTTEALRKISEAQKRNWANPEFKNRMVSATRKAVAQRPNKAEAKLMELLNIACPNQYKYTGDGSVVLNGLCPDFTNCNGQKKVVEMFGSYWHRGANPNDRIDKFAGFGFQCLVIWEHEMKKESDEVLVQRIREFNNV